MASGSEAAGRGSSVTVDHGGRQQDFAAEDLPVTFGSSADSDVVLDGVQGSIQIGRLDAVFFVQPGRNARNVRVGGELLTSSRALRDSDVISFDRARLECRIAAGRLAIRTDSVVTAGDTAPPDLEVLARGARSAEIEITPIAFKPAAAAVRRAAKPGVNKAMAMASTAAVVLVTVAWFAFTAKSVAIDIEPTPAAMSLPSTLFKLQLGDRYLLRAGSHRVAAELPGYYPLDAKIEVGPQSDQTIALTMTKLPGLVTITTEPEIGAQVLLDGTPLGTTPITDIELPPGVHRLEFSAERHLGEIRELEVNGGGERQSLTATLTPNWAVVSLRTDPPGATVLVDGVEAGVTPADVDIDSGEHELEVRLAGYNAWSNRVIVAANQPQTLPDIKLALADGRLELASTPSEASVNVDGEFRGRTPLSLRLTPGRAHRVTLTKPGYETTTRELSVGADSGRRLQIELTPQLGEIEVASTPPNAEVWVDGERRGSTPTTLELTAVSHDIEIRQQGFAIERAALTPRPGYPQKLERTLVALNESSGGGFAQSLRTSQQQELKLVPAGQFTMGSSRREVGRRSNEILRPVRVTRAFYLGANEVTNAEFRAFKPDHDSGSAGDHSLNSDDQPVANVAWDDVAQYLNWLSVKDGLQPVYEQRGNVWQPVRPLRNGYRLPTEAEWEWAARFAGQDAGLLYPWGAEMPPPDRSGNYADVTAVGIAPTTLVTYNDGEPVAAPVRRYQPNAYGIYDLGGNVAEWVQDFYVPDVVETTERADDPLGPATGRVHVIRGASWRSATVTDLRLAARASGVEGRDDVGFRIARNLQ